MTNLSFPRLALMAGEPDLIEYAMQLSYDRSDLSSQVVGVHRLGIGRARGSSLLGYNKL